MKIRTLFLLIIFFAIATFVALNWSAFISPTNLSLGVGTVQAPLGLVMLGLLVLLTVTFLVFATYLKTSVLLESRRHFQELHSARELAEKAEASRFTELHEFLETELKRVTAIYSESTSSVLARLDQIEVDLASAAKEIEQKFDALSAGETGKTKIQKNISMKKAYEGKLQARLDECSDEINKLKAKADTVEGDEQLKYFEQIQKLREKQTAAQKKLRELKEADEDAWENIKAGIHSTWESLGDALKSTRNIFR